MTTARRSSVPKVQPATWTKALQYFRSQQDPKGEPAPGAPKPASGPPLRARGRDVLLLAQRFTRRSAERAGKGVAGLSRAEERRYGDTLITRFRRAVASGERRSTRG